MKCAFCGYEFDPAQAQVACAGCPLTGDCRLIRCPQCGYETLPEAKLVNWLRGLRARWQAQYPSSIWRRHNEDQ